MSGPVPSGLHLALQQYYAGDDGIVEAELRGYRADVIRDDIVYEIQTGSFSAIRDKLKRLSRTHRTVLVFPIACRKLIVKLDPETGDEVAQRYSPKREKLSDIFDHLVYAPTMLRRKKFALEVALTKVCEYRQDDGEGSWRRKGVSIVGRELLEIESTQRFDVPTDLLSLLPEHLPDPFTVADLVRLGKMRKRVAGRMAYVMRQLRIIAQVGKQGNAYLYRRK